MLCSVRGGLIMLLGLSQVGTSPAGELPPNLPPEPGPQQGEGDSSGRVGGLITLLAGLTLGEEKG